jgi:putative aldouronate transport system permease protein
MFSFTKSQNNEKVKFGIGKTSRFYKELPLHLMLLVPAIFVLVFSYGSIVGIIMAFQDYIPGSGWYIFGSPFIGFDNFVSLFSMPNLARIIGNTLFIAGIKTIAGIVLPLLFAIFMNEIRKKWLKKSIQTAVFLPHFISWVILSGILIDVLSPSTGFLAGLLNALGVETPFFLGDNKWFPWVLILSHLWKEVGFGMIIYLAAITSIDSALYEAATIDGCGHFKKTIHITLPGMSMVIILLAILSIGNILNAGFEQVFNLYSPVVYESGDIIDTFVFRMGISQGQYSLATTVGLLKSLVSFTFISVSYYLAYKFADYRIF